MTARADRLTSAPNRRLSQFRSIVLPCEQRVFVDALERLNYSVESCWATPGSVERI